MLLARDQEPDLGENRLMKRLKKHLPITDQLDGRNFFTVQNGKRVGTRLFLALLLVEMMDLLFAVDSIPAIFAVTRDPFIVFTSNVFAIMGLRSLYFVLPNAIDGFHYLKAGLAAVLVFVGLKMIGLVHVSVGISLLVVVTILAIAISASLVRSRFNSEKS
jgi:tellurite resistance protein TerC